LDERNLVTRFNRKAPDQGPGLFFAVAIQIRAQTKKRPLRWPERAFLHIDVTWSNRSPLYRSEETPQASRPQRPRDANIANPRPANGARREFGAERAISEGANEISASIMDRNSCLSMKYRDGGNDP
jgi:hypothetical protein